MLGALRIAAQRSALRAPTRAALPQVRSMAMGIKILEDKGKAAEKMYWMEEDAKLIKKMLENHPELDPQYQGIANLLSGDSKDASLTDKVKSVFAKHGIPPVNKALVSDIVALLEAK